MPDSKSREPGFESPLCYCFKVCAFLLSRRRPSSLNCINEYLAVDSGGNVSDLVFARNCYVARSRVGVGMNMSAM